MVNRIAVFSTPRTKSSFVLHAACKHYNAKNHYELWTGIHSIILKVPLPNVWDIWKRKIQIKTQELFTRDINFGLKVWAPAFINKHEFLNNRDKFLANPTVLFNLTEHFNFNQYTEFYILKRNTTDMICSWLHGKETELWGYNSSADIKQYHPMYYKSNFDENFKTYQNLLDWLIYSSLVIDRIEPYLQSINKQYHLLDFDEIPSFVENKFNLTSPYIPNDFKYSDVVKNYNLFDEYVQEKKEFFLKHTQNFNFY